MLFISYDNVQLGAGGGLASYSTATATADTQFLHNAYRHSGGNWKYRYADTAARLRVNSPGRTWIFESAASGSADGDITFSEQLRITSNGDLMTGGITSGAGKVQVGGGLRIAGSATHTDTPSPYLYRTSGADNLCISTSALERLRIDSDGRVLIGTSSLIDSSTASNFQIASSSGPRLCIARNNTNVTGGNLMGAIDFYGNDSDGNYEICGRMILEADGTHTTDAKPTRMAFYTTPSGSDTATERLRITSEGEVLIANTTNRFLSLDRTNASSGSGEFNINVESNSQATISYDDGSQIVIGTSSSPRSQAGFSEKLRLNSDGKLILSMTERSTPHGAQGDGAMFIEQSYDGNLYALMLRNKDTGTSASTALGFSLNRSGGDTDFESGKIAMVKEQAWTTSSSTVDSAMTFSTATNQILAERLYNFWW